METRLLGRTEHKSTVAVFGGGALGKISQAEADAALERVLAAGVNHIDVAPSYGEAELRLAPWMARERDRFFLGCKTLERNKTGAGAELRRSLERLKTDHTDLYQFHAVNHMEELDKVTAPGGALEAVVAAREEGLTRFIGITGHGLAAPKIFQEALHRFDFNTVMFPVNFILFADPDYRKQARDLLLLCREQRVGTLAIKAVAKQPWPGGWQGQPTWYEPFHEHQHIQDGVNFALSQDVTALCTPSDPALLSLVLEACENYARLDAQEQEALIDLGQGYDGIFTPQGRKGLD